MRTVGMGEYGNDEAESKSFGWVDAAEARCLIQFKCGFKDLAEFGIIVRVVDVDALKSVLGREFVLLLDV